MADVLDYFAQQTFTRLLTQNLSRDDPVSRSLGNGAYLLFVFVLVFFFALSLSSYLPSCPKVCRLLKIT